MSNTANVSAGKRIMALLDDNSFVEIGNLVKARNTDFNIQQKDTPADGVITGYGLVDGRLVYVYSQDASVLNGSMGEMHAKKIINVYKLAMKTGAPVIGLVDCAGLRLQEASDALNAFGRLYMVETMASGVVPQITGIFGTCGGGMAIIPTLTDFTFMEEKNAKLFVNSPNAIDGNYEAKCNSASAKFQSEEAGIVDGTGSEDEILAKIRELVTYLPSNNEDDDSYLECTDDLNRVCEGIEGAAGDTSILISNIADNNAFFEIKAGYAKDMVCGFIRMNGQTVGVVANRTEIIGEDGKASETFEGLSAEGCEKAASFVEFCDAFNISVVSFTNVKGYKATMCQEKKLAKAAAKLIFAFTNATVPKINVIVGNAYGSAYVAMNSKALGADMVFAWPNASVGMMDAEQAVRIMYADEIKASDNANALIAEKSAEYASLQSGITAAAGRGYVDSVIEAQDTRKYLIGALEMLFTKREDRPAKKHGCVL